MVRPGPATNRGRSTLTQLLPDPETLEADDEDRWEDAEVDLLGGLLMGGAEPKVRQGWHHSNKRSRSSDSEL